MKFALCILGLVALVSSATHGPTVTKKPADELLLNKQKQLLELIWRVHQPVIIPRVLEVATNYDIQGNLDKYSNVEAVKRFVTYYKRGFLPRGEVFSILYEQQRNEVISLFDLFYYAKDFDTFYKTAAWARVNINAGQFYYALSVAVLHREDTHGLVLPAPYEVYPQLFVDTEVIQQAIEKRMLVPISEYSNVVVIPVNKTGFYPYYQYQDNEKHFAYQRDFYGYDSLYHSRPEDRLTYFTEDVALNTYYNYLHMDNPFWMNKTYAHKGEHRGELFYYTNQQLLARYILERFSNDLLDIDVLNYDLPIETGYNPNLRYPNGQDFPVRSDNIVVSKINSYEIQLVEDFERRIRDAIDLGYVWSKTGEKVYLTEAEGMDILGQLIESTVDSVNYNYYGKLYQLTLQLLGHIVDPIHTAEVAPGVLENFETVLRDPVYYRFLASISRLFLRYKSLLPHYLREELAFPGVKITSLELDKFITYMEQFDFDISNSVLINKVEEDLVIKAREYRLNHKPFNFKINMQSDKAVDATVRVFIGPKYDSEGRVLSINEKRRLMVELDRFPYTLAVGENTISRNSRDIFSSIDDMTTVRDLYKQVSDAIQGKGQFLVENIDRHCGFPNRLLLPKGKRGGMPFTFFVTVTPTTVTDVKYDETYHGCGTGFGLQYKDQYAMGYPFDRVIDETQFFVPNFFEKDVMIFHKRFEEINNQSI